MSFNPADLLFLFTILLLSLSVHEAAHAWTAAKLGDPTAEMLGRVTLNPLRHIDLIGTVLFPMVAYMTGWFFGWAKPVPVNPANLKHERRDHALIAAAGPASNIVMGLGFLAGLKLLQAFFAIQIASQHDFVYPLSQLFWYGIFLNFILAAFNLLPLPPLDGGWILAGLLPGSVGRLLNAVQPVSFIILIGLALTGVLGSILSPVYRLVNYLVL